MKRTATLPVLLATAWVLALPAHSAPKPSEVPISWQMEYDFQRPRAVEVTLPGQMVPRRFWYMIYTVTNHTGKELIFVPEFVLYTDTGQVLRAGQKVPSAVFKHIKKLYNNPLLSTTTEVTGKLLQGEDNAKDGIAIWPAFDPHAGAFEILIGGLSGETAEVQLPVAIETTEIDPTGKVATVVKNKVILSRTLRLQYSLPGEAAARNETSPKLEKKDWVMR